MRTLPLPPTASGGRVGLTSLPLQTSWGLGGRIRRWPPDKSGSKAGAQGGSSFPAAVRLGHEPAPPTQARGAGGRNARASPEARGRALLATSCLARLRSCPRGLCRMRGAPARIPPEPALPCSWT
eukprot:9491097-Pyramimonas_sp.AAC.3